VHVLLGVCGGIAAYKAAELVRALRGAGHEVRCALTRSAEAFVTPLTLEVLTGRSVYRQEYLAPTGTGEELHIEAAAWADVLCVAPATAHTLGRLALGLGDDFLSTTALAFDGPVVVAPAMHSVMWLQDSVQENVRRLRHRGVRVVGPVVGELASGESGVGRLVDLGVLVDEIERCERTRELTGTTVLVTAGPTREVIDPVRFLSNRSSGRMGFAMAAEAVRRGARCILVAGPVDLPTPSGVERIDVVSAAEMAAAVDRWAGEADLIVMAAAVGDFRPATASEHKLKKDQFDGRLGLERTEDILAGLARTAPDAIRVGFAAETEDLYARAQRKLEDKHAQFVVANDVSRSDIGFGQLDNEVVVFAHGAEPVKIPKALKTEIARIVLDLVAPAVLARRTATRRAAS
jgi:phosphopantothenoylcysteine decarboxylase / phosphopantothenate---cysteine ligase